MSGEAHPRVAELLLEEAREKAEEEEKDAMPHQAASVVFTHDRHLPQALVDRRIVFDL
jgi:hypothetical protein